MDGMMTGYWTSGGKKTGHSDRDHEATMAIGELVHKAPMKGSYLCRR